MSNEIEVCTNKDEIISYIKEKTLFFNEISNNTAKLYQELNNLKNTSQLELLLETYKTSAGQILNILRYAVLNAIKNNEIITSELVEEIKEKIVSKDLNYLKKYLDDTIIQSIIGYKSKNGGNPFRSWIAPFRIFYTFFYYGECKNNIIKYLKNLGNSIISELNLIDYKISLTGFEGPQNQGQNNVWVNAFPERLKNYNNSICFFFEIKDGKLLAGITKSQKNKNPIELKPEFLSKEYASYDEAIQVLKSAKEYVVNMNDNIKLEDFNLLKLFEMYSLYKNSTEYDEEYKWDFAEQYEGQFRNLDNILEKLAKLPALNIQSFFIKNCGIKWLVDKHPNILLQAFGELFDTNKNLINRIENFRKIIKDCFITDDNWKNKNLADPGVDTASYFLFTDDYHSNLLFTKVKPFNNFAKKLKLTTLLKFDSNEERYLAWQNYCLDTLIPEMDEYFNKKHTLLDAQDFIWFAGNHSAEEDADIEKVTRYWMLSAGHNNNKWEYFKTNSIIAVGWEELGDLTQYKTREDIKNAMVSIYNQQNPRNDSLAAWQFVNDIKIGDIVYIKSSRTEVVARGIVESDYTYDNTQENYRSIRKVNWTHFKTVASETKWAVKTLTDITPYTEDLKTLEAGFNMVDSYTKEDFLNDVFMVDEKYEILKNLLLNKKNIILQGAPGTGKTFCAKRLAYSIIGKIDTSKVKMVQFHQSYGYENFIMGYRPAKDGFEIKNGPFYEFCKTAEDDKENKYFFIIDEINRGRISKIFGELLMLIETDKRGQSLQLLYEDKPFSVPKNVYIIGMMKYGGQKPCNYGLCFKKTFFFL